MRSVWATLFFAAVGVPTTSAADFAKDIVPILERHCVRCHQPGIAKGDISLATAADLLTGEYVVPGQPDESGILELVSAKPGKRPRMPKEGKTLSATEVDLLKLWITEGATWPKDVIVQEKAKADKSWWSLKPLSSPAPPNPAGLPPAWAANSIDRFIYAKLADKGLKPSAPADPRTLVRRITYDLTGLPPTPESVEAFAKDPSDAAYSKLVEVLLKSPAYGERWGRHWLDVVRFGESNGFERNVLYHSAWPFRDYVIRSLNDDKPFDRLVREHLAGDQLAPGDAAVEVGTAFLVVGAYDDVGNQDAAQAAAIRANTLDDMVRATGEAFLGVTVGCARCHNHKFDPITQQDYHRLAATFAGVNHGERQIVPAKVRSELGVKMAAIDARRNAILAHQNLWKTTQTSELEHRVPMWKAELAQVELDFAALPKFPSWWVGQFQPAAGPFHVFTGGDAMKKGELVAFASPAFLSDAGKGYDLPAKATEAERRLALAEWIVAPDNPLTPRVLANRLWGWHFGTGIVDTPSDFGYMGGLPTHSELLDWLAGQLQKEKWQLKPMHRLIVTSQAYRQSSAFRNDAAATDGNSRLLWRYPPRRLSAEEVRDSMLSISGRLDPKMGGPGFQLYQYSQDNVSTYTPLDAPGAETYRRSVYHQNARAARVDLLTDFDCPDPASAAPRRSSTTTPSQALTLFNHKFTLDMAEALATRLKADGGPKIDAQLERLYRLIYGRTPTVDELLAGEKFIRSQSLRAFCRAVLNSNEFLYVD